MINAKVTIEKGDMGSTSSVSISNVIQKRKLQILQNIHPTEATMPCCGPGYASPAEAVKGPIEKVLFVTCAHTKTSEPDAIATVDVDPESKTFCQIISKVIMPHTGDEVHHSGWNACSSCYDKPSAKRTHLIAPCLNSNRIYIINVENPNDIRLEKTIESEELAALNVSFPHTSHCLADGNIMISTLGDAHGENMGNFVLLDGRTFDPTKLWMENGRSLAFNYDFWYQPRNNIMISSEWGTPNKIKDGFDPAHVAEGHYGHSLHIFDWTTHALKQSIELPMPQGAIPLEVRFHHEPTSRHAFVGCALGSTVFHLHPENEESSRYVADCVIEIPNKSVEGWCLPEMPGLITDILLSMDDKFLYLVNWFHGDLRQYDITNPSQPKLTGQVFLGGCIHTESGIQVTKDEELTAPPPPCIVKGRTIHGGPQMMQLSLDGKRLYVTMSLYRKWDEQFYPKLIEEGATMLSLDINPEGGMTLNENFLVDFGKMEGGPYLGHEMRYPGGDCTSDIWI